MRSYGATSPGQLISAMRGDGFNLWRRGNAFLASKKNGKPFVLFIIKASVTIPSRPFLYISESEEKFIAHMIQNSVMKSLEEDK